MTWYKCSGCSAWTWSHSKRNGIKCSSCRKFISVETGTVSMIAHKSHFKTGQAVSV